MKEIRSTLIFMLLAFVALGYLLSDVFNTRKELVQFKQQNQKLLDENVALQSDNESLTQSLAESEQKVKDLTQVNLYQQEQITLLTEENSSLKSVLGGSQRQFESSTLLQSLSTTPLAWAILVPAIPASLIASYGIVYYTRNNSRRSKKKGQRKEYIQLTGEEIDKVIQMRRSK